MKTINRLNPSSCIIFLMFMCFQPVHSQSKQQNVQLSLGAGYFFGFNKSLSKLLFDKYQLKSSMGTSVQFSLEQPKSFNICSKMNFKFNSVQHENDSMVFNIQNYALGYNVGYPFKINQFTIETTLGFFGNVSRYLTSIEIEPSNLNDLFSSTGFNSKSTIGNMGLGITSEVQFTYCFKPIIKKFRNENDERNRKVFISASYGRLGKKNADYLFDLRVLKQYSIINFGYYLKM